jgi:hypothetical protein
MRQVFIRHINMIINLKLARLQHFYLLTPANKYGYLVIYVHEYVHQML